MKKKQKKVFYKKKQNKRFFKHNKKLQIPIIQEKDNFLASIFRFRIHITFDKDKKNRGLSPAKDTFLLRAFIKNLKNVKRSKDHNKIEPHKSTIWKHPTISRETSKGKDDSAIKTFQHGSFKKTFKKYESDLQLILIPIILLIVLEIIYVLNTRVDRVISDYQVGKIQSNAPIYPYPILKHVPQPYVSAEAAIIMDQQTQAILYSKNPTLSLSMASTTKIMTALVALRYYNNDSILTIITPHVDGSGLGFYQGERFYFHDLLYAMLLPSANDAAQAIADNYPGGAQAFVAKMNEKAQSLHLTDMHYSDAVGLDDDGDYTTVVDLARLASIAIRNIEFADVTGTKQTTINDIDNTRQYPLANLNKLLGQEGVTGIKTGTTEGAGEVLVTATNINGRTYIIIVMDSQDRFADTQTLLTFLHKNLQYVSPSLPPDNSL